MLKCCFKSKTKVTSLKTTNCTKVELETKKHIWFPLGRKVKNKKQTTTKNEKQTNYEQSIIYVPLQKNIKQKNDVNELR